MNEISIEEIDDFKIKELSQYFFGASDLSFKIAEKKIGNLDTEDLLYLLRRSVYKEIAVLLAVREMENNGFYGHGFDDKSIIQQDILKELILLPDYFWNYNQRSYCKLKPLVEEHGIHARISYQIIKQFLELDLQPIIWTESEINHIAYFEVIGILSMFEDGKDSLKKLKRAVDEGIEVTLNWKTKITPIRNESDIKEYIIPLLTKDPDYLEDFEEVIANEIKILF
ncbi:hypothetical protein FY557_08420 [Chryseobacterium sp. SN22]|uniref:hypothetical protein n=1 Tax=Chryseobacterium sp. SN22 TaxID=2606431 RepID=UPI0011ED08E1|nr:hypothetical protein [Chryseobacterium sp. SN22]KAA0128592.1 hypothetical protein FY557_08420 [Chryseobacterium sp. SN22]